MDEPLWVSWKVLEGRVSVNLLSLNDRILRVVVGFWHPPMNGELRGS
jgi:hypothetical protein